MLSILRKIEYIKKVNFDEKVFFSGISYHSQKVKQGDLFVCIKGYKSDGHKYAGDAVQRGAVVLVVEDYQPQLKIPQIVVQNSRRALAHISSIYCNDSSKKLKTVGITGTNGKTTTTYMIDKIFNHSTMTNGLIGSVSIKNGAEVIPSKLTTPESLELQKHLSAMVENNIEAVAMEVSSSGLDLDRVAFIDYDIGIVNNIFRDHLDLHGSFEEYLEAKKKLFRMLDENSFALINGDCTYSRELAKESTARNLTFGMKESSFNFTAKDVKISGDETSYTFCVNHPIETENGVIEPVNFTIELQVIGEHNVYNSLVAAAVSLLLGVDVSIIRKSLYEFAGVERRFELIYNHDFKVIDDQFGNESQIQVSFDTIKQMNYNNLSVLYGIRGNRGKVVNSESAEAIARGLKDVNLDSIILTTYSDYTTSKDQVSKEELDCVVDILKREGIRCTVYESLSESLQAVLRQTGENDLILIGGCQGMDPAAELMLQFIYEEKIRKFQWSEKEIEEFKNHIFAPIVERVSL